MSYTQEVVRGSAMYFVGGILAAGIAYLTKLVLVRNLTVEEYGLFFAVFTFVLFFTVFRSLGMNQGLARFIAEYSLTKRFPEIKSLIVGSALLQFIVSSIVVIVVWLLAPWLAENYFGSSDAIWLLRVMILYLPLMILSSNTRSVLQGFKIISWYSFADLADNLLVLLLIIGGLLLGFEVYSAAIGYLGSIILFFLVFGFVVVKKTKIFSYKQKNFFSENKKLLLFSLPLLLTATGSTIISYFDTLMLTYFDTILEVGVYNIVYPSSMLLAIIGGSLGAILLPVITQMWVSEKKKETGKALEIMYVYVFALILPAIIVLSIFSKELLGLFFGSEYVIGAAAFSVLLVGGMFSAIIAINNQVLVAIEKPKQTMSVYFIGSIANIALNLVLIPQYSLLGAAIASVLSFLLMIVVSLYYIKEDIHIRLPVRKIVLCLVSAASIPFVIQQLMNLLSTHIYVSAIISSAVAGVAYLGLLFLLRVIRVREIIHLYKS
ncbi:MAG: flippase [Candidatus Woesearchaeota archaeon]